VSALADDIPGALGIVWLRGSGTWVPHFRAMPAGVYDAAVAMGDGVRVSVLVPARYAFVGY
jgi:hypothetical protein